MKNVITPIPKKWPSENWQSSWVPGARAGNVLYISGIAASGTDGQPVGINDFKAQAEWCLKKLGDVLGRVGADYGNVVKLTTYMVPVVGAEQVCVYFEMRKAFFGESLPASTGITVHSLVRPEYLIEIDAIAHLDEE